MGKKYDYLLRENAKIRGKRWKKEGKEEIFTVIGGKNIILERGGGKNINYLDNYTPDHMIKNEILLHWLDVEFLVGEKITTHPTIFGNLTLTLI